MHLKVSTGGSVPPVVAKTRGVVKRRRQALRSRSTQSNGKETNLNDVVTGPSIGKAERITAPKVSVSLICSQKVILPRSNGRTSRDNGASRRDVMIAKEERAKNQKEIH